MRGITFRRLWMECSDQAKEILAENLKNLKEKAATKQKLTAQEVALLEAASTGPPSNWAKNQVKLAAALGVNRKTVQRWVKEGAPDAHSDGRYSIPEWQAWIAANGKKALPSGEDDLNQTTLKAKQILLQNKKLEYQLAILRKEFVSVAEVEKAAGDMISQAKKFLLAGPGSLAPLVVGLNVPEAEKMLREWIIDAIGQLSNKPFEAEGGSSSE